MDPVTVVWLFIAAVAIVVTLIGSLALAKNYQRVGPNEALIIFGGRERTLTAPMGRKSRSAIASRSAAGPWSIPSPRTPKPCPWKSIP